MEIELVKTCEACPEQYDAKSGERTVGYLRLRWGYFTVYCPDVRGEEVYEAEVGDGAWSGQFTDDERATHLPKAVEAIERWHERQEEKK